MTLVNRFTESIHEPVNNPFEADVHQHLWPAPLLEALRARREAPRLRGWTLALDGEPEYEVDPRAHDPATRAAQARADGLDIVIVAPSTTLGLEHLPPREAAPALDAYHEGALALPPPFRAWAAAAVNRADPAALTNNLQRGFVGLALPATALLDADGYERMRPLLNVLEDAGRPLLIHPGPAPATARTRHPGRGPATTPATPRWWAPVVTYVQQMHAAWFAFRAHGRPRHARLKTCFALLAGLAPLHGERFAARAHERSPVDQDAFLDVSSYGTRAVDAVVRVLGIDVVVNGSDRPYATPQRLDLGAAATAALRRDNVARLLDLKEVPNELAVTSGAQP